LLHHLFGRVMVDLKDPSDVTGVKKKWLAENASVENFK
jgi:hypothetical protein